MTERVMRAVLDELAQLRGNVQTLHGRVDALQEDAEQQRDELGELRVARHNTGYTHATPARGEASLPHHVSIAYEDLKEDADRVRLLTRALRNAEDKITIMAAALREAESRLDQHDRQHMQLMQAVEDVRSTATLASHARAFDPARRHHPADDDTTPGGLSRLGMVHTSRELEKSYAQTDARAHALAAENKRLRKELKRARAELKDSAATQQQQQHSTQHSHHIALSHAQLAAAAGDGGARMHSNASRARIPVHLELAEKLVARASGRGQGGRATHGSTSAYGTHLSATAAASPQRTSHADPHDLQQENGRFSTFGSPAPGVPQNVSFGSHSTAKPVALSAKPSSLKSQSSPQRSVQAAAALARQSTGDRSVQLSPSTPLRAPPSTAGTDLVRKVSDSAHSQSASLVRKTRSGASAGGASSTRYVEDRRAASASEGTQSFRLQPRESMASVTSMAFEEIGTEHGATSIASEEAESIPEAKTSSPSSSAAGDPLTESISLHSVTTDARTKSEARSRRSDRHSHDADSDDSLTFEPE